MLSLERAKKIAIATGNKLLPYCDRLNIAGSIRRGKMEVGDIELVCQPKKVWQGTKTLFGEDNRQEVIHPDFIKSVLSLGKVIKGKPEGRMMQIELKIKFYDVKTIMLDLFMPQPYDYYRIYAIRTGSSEYSHHVIAKGWLKRGWVGTKDGLRLEMECVGSKNAEGKVIWRCTADKPTLPPSWQTEQEFFEWLGVQYLPPSVRVMVY